MSEQIKPVLSWLGHYVPICSGVENHFQKMSFLSFSRVSDPEIQCNM